MKTPMLSVAMFAVAAGVGALGQYLYKSGADRLTESFASAFNGGYSAAWRVISR